MATIYSDAEGKVLRFLGSAELEKKYPTPPAGTVSTLVFDEDTNPSLVTDLAQSTDPFRLLGPLLTKSGQIMTIAPEGQDRLDRTQLQTIDDTLAAYIANPSPTTPQTVATVKALARLGRFTIRRGLRAGWL